MVQAQQDQEHMEVSGSDGASRWDDRIPRGFRNKIVLTRADSEVPAGGVVVVPLELHRQDRRQGRALTTPPSAVAQSQTAA